MASSFKPFQAFPGRFKPFLVVSSPSFPKSNLKSQNDIQNPPNLPSSIRHPNARQDVRLHIRYMHTAYHLVSSRCTSPIPRTPYRCISCSLMRRSQWPHCHPSSVSGSQSLLAPQSFLTPSLILLTLNLSWFFPNANVIYCQHLIFANWTRSAQRSSKTVSANTQRNGEFRSPYSCTIGDSVTLVNDGLTLFFASRVTQSADYVIAFSQMPLFLSRT